MSIDYTALDAVPRLLIEAPLKPLQGDRFQPTGFAHLGPARYTLHDGTEMLLLESAQSVANRMEMACCKDDGFNLLKELQGLPFVASKRNGSKNDSFLTTSYLEAHRMSSPYLLNDEWAETLATEMKLKDNEKLDHSSIVKTLFKYDPCCLLHGVWFALDKYKQKFSGGRVRISRSLSGFIEASGVRVAESGGTKFDKNSARTDEEANTKTGYGTLPFPRTEFTAKCMTAYFNVDLALLRGYGLGEDATQLLITLALFKIRRFLSTGLRLRTACDLTLGGHITVTKPEGFKIPQEHELLEECTTKIASCKSLFADPPITEVTY